MQKQHAFTLIDGTFSVDDAHNILDTLLGAKIKFHKSHKFSLEERHGHDHLDSHARVEQLRASREELHAFIDQLEKDGMEMEITSEVKIQVRKKEGVAA